MEMKEIFIARKMGIKVEVVVVVNDELTRDQLTDRKLLNYN